MSTNDLRNEELLEYENEDTQKDRYLTFKIANEEYGIEIRFVVYNCRYSNVLRRIWMWIAKAYVVGKQVDV